MESFNDKLKTLPGKPRQKDVVGKACCIAGMHRSGTSMVAQLLHACGIFLGPVEELKRASRHNERGYFENLSLFEINEQLLREFHGQWDAPPEFPDDWGYAPRAEALMPKARKLVRRFANSHWGWKDPRNSLTLPFWFRVVPDLKVIVCVRNPLEVVRSLFLRGRCGNPSELQLWNTYYQRLLAATSSTNRFVTHYESYFENPQAELRRLVNWLELDVSDETIERACAQISTNMRHHEIPGSELLGANVPDEVLGTYFNLCAEAGPIYRGIRRKEQSSPSPTDLGFMKEISVLRNELLELRAYQQEIFNSRSYKLISLWWRMPRFRKLSKVAVNSALIAATTWYEQA